MANTLNSEFSFGLSLKKTAQHPNPGSFLRSDPGTLTSHGTVDDLGRQQAEVMAEGNHDEVIAELADDVLDTLEDGTPSQICQAATWIASAVLNGLLRLHRTLRDHKPETEHG